MAGRFDALPRNYPAHPSGRDRFSPLPNKYRGIGGTPRINESHVSIQGANVLYEHFMAAAAIVEQTMPEILNAVGDLGVEEARRLVPFDTGATFDSITIVGGSSQSLGGGFGFRSAGESQYFVEVGPETFYAPFLEYGTIHMAPRPFMMPAADLMEQALQMSVGAVLAAVLEGEGGEIGGAGGPGGRVLSDPRVRSPFTGLRSFLYSASKALGDISVLGGRGLFGPARTQMLGLARMLGDVSSVMNQSVSQRVTNRLSGRVTGHIIGFGSRSMSFGKNYSAFPGGSSGHRIYQRVAGRASRGGVGNFGSSSFISRLMNG